MNTETVQQTSIRFTHTLTVGPLVGVFDPNKFFHDRRDDVNLYVWGDFESRILYMLERPPSVFRIRT